MSVRVYVIPISNPSRAGAAMLAHKRVPHRVVSLMPGVHPLLVRFAGFERHTVPALEHDGRRVQGSLEISRYLDRVWPDLPLFPAEPEALRRVEQAERWGERVLQPVPRRLFRHLMLRSERARLWLGTEVLHVPAPRAAQVLFMPAIRRLAAISHADEATVLTTLARLPELLDEVDDLIAGGVIAGTRPNAADFQILASVRVLLEFEDLAPALEGRACVPAARRLYPDWPGPIPRGLPAG